MQIRATEIPDVLIRCIHRRKGARLKILLTGKSDQIGYELGQKVQGLGEIIALVNQRSRTDSLHHEKCTGINCPPNRKASL